MKIGLIAMSGIRACDEALMKLGLTLPGFVERSNVIASLPSLGLLTLAGMTPPAHEVGYMEVADLEDGRKAQEKMAGFDLVAISSYSAQIKEAYALADKARELNVPVVMGGLHATVLPREAKQHCDAVVMGEGELVWPELVRDVEKRALKPFYGGNGREFDLASSPMPAFELLDIEQYNRLTVQTSRGCVHRCEFCASSTLLTKYYKQKPEQRVLAEIDKICDIWKRPFIEFADDNTFVNRDYWKALLPKLKQRKIRWFTETDLSIARDPDLLKLMRDSGCAQVLVGLESPAAEALSGIEKKSDWKFRQWPRHREAVHTIQSHGISVNGCFILGLDGQDAGVFDRIYDFVRDSHLHEVQITLQTPFPGTPLYRRLDDEGRLIHPTAWEMCTLFDLNFTPRGMSAEALSEGFRQLGVRLYGEEFTRQRQARFRDYVRAYLEKRRTGMETMT